MTISRTVIILLALLVGLGVFAGRSQEPMAQANAAPPNTAEGQLARIEALEKETRKLRKKVLELKRAHRIIHGDAAAVRERKREMTDLTKRLLAEMRQSDGGDDDGNHALQLTEKLIRAEMAKGTWRGVRRSLLLLLSYTDLEHKASKKGWEQHRDQLKDHLELIKISIRDHERLSKGIQAWSKEHVDRNRASFDKIDKRLKILEDRE